MPELSFRVNDVCALPYAAVPTICACIGIEDARATEEIRGLCLNCEVLIDPLRRKYTAVEESRLLELFGERESWARTMKPMVWANISVKVPGFSGATSADVQLPCSLDFDVAATKYFYGIESGSIGIVMRFGGTVFMAGFDGELQMQEIPRGHEIRFDLPVEVWQAAIGAHYGHTTWLRLPRDVFDRLYHFKVSQGIPSWPAVIAQLLDEAEHVVPGMRPAATAQLEPGPSENCAFDSVALLQ